MPELPLGRYRHFKGAYYQLLMMAVDSETQEPVAIYRAERDGVVYVRKVAMFSEQVTYQGEIVNRFTWISSR